MVKQVGQFQHRQLMELQSEAANRKYEFLKMYRPTDLQQKFHECMARERLVIGGNRSGKSMSTFVEDARAATGQDPFGKYPAENGTIVIVGKDWKHIGLVVYEMLFKCSKTVKVIRDLQTNEWRIFDWKKDADRRAEAKPAPPMIPPRMIKSKAWLMKKQQYIQRCELINGWTIHFFSSEGDPPQGFAADLYHIDEDIEDENWVGEAQARLADTKGRFVWSAMPHSKNDALVGLSERAEASAEAGEENPTVVKFTLPFLRNPYIDDDEKRKMIEGWRALGEDVLRMRADGEFSTESILVYPTFNQSVHLYDKSQLPGGVIPRDWCRFLAIDPGHSVAACLFLAVPPDESMWLIYDELYLRQASAVKFAEALKLKIDGNFRTFIIDGHGARLTDIGSGKSALQQYSDEMRARDIRSETTGHAFLFGCDDIESRTMAVRTALHIRGDGTTKLKVLRDGCPNLIRELRRYKKKTVMNAGVRTVTDQPNTRGEVHACQCMEYLVAHQPRYHKPAPPPVPETWIDEWVRKRNRRKGPACVYLGPQSGMQEEN
jgi:hypothetical protein